MNAWLIERRQQVLTSEDMTAEQIRAVIAEYDNLQKGAELTQPDLVAIVVSDVLEITEAFVDFKPAREPEVDDVPARPAPKVVEPAPPTKPVVHRPVVEKPEVQASELVLVECEHCNRTFANQHGLEVHIGRTHRTIEPDPEGHRSECDLCGASFYNLTRHMEQRHPQGDELQRRRREAGLA